MENKPLKILRPDARDLFHAVEHLDDGIADKDWNRVKIAVAIVKRVCERQMNINRKNDTR